MFCTDGRVMGGENCVFADWKSLNFNSKEIECVYIDHVAHKFHYLLRLHIYERLGPPSI